MPRANAALTERGRLRLASGIVDRNRHPLRSRTGPGARWNARFGSCGRRSGGDRPAAAAGSACPPRPATPSSPGSARPAWRTWTGKRTTRQRRDCKPVIGYAYLHAWFASCGITVRRVLTDNGSCYRSFLWRDIPHAAGTTVKRTRPFRPQTNGKVERSHCALADEWPYAKAYSLEAAHRAALPAWLHAYNNHRSHTALGGHPPASRVPTSPDKTSRRRPCVRLPSRRRPPSPRRRASHSRM